MIVSPFVNAVLRGRASSQPSPQHFIFFQILLKYITVTDNLSVKRGICLIMSRHITAEAMPQGSSIKIRFAFAPYIDLKSLEI